MGHIFISYSHKDTDYAHGLADHLKGMGFDVWIDERLDYGSQWPQEIQKQLDSCDAFILIMTPRSFTSEWVQSELQRAKRKLKPIFPLLLEGDEPWLSVESTQYYDVRGESFPDAKFYSALKRVISSGPTISTQEMSRRLIAARSTETSSAPKSRTRIIVGVLGFLAVVMLACTAVIVIVRLFVFDSQSPLIPDTAPQNNTEIERSTSTPEPTSTATSIPPSATSVPPTDTPTSHAPVIDSVYLREDSSSGNLIIYQDVSFRDEDGDAYFIDFELVSDNPNLVTRDGPIEALGQQETGAIHTGTWHCGDDEYQATLQVTILDRAGNKSNTVEYTMFCHQ
jgi:hypothetical protein